MASRIETLVRSAVRLFSSINHDLPQQASSLLTKNPSFLELCHLASSITCEDVGLPRPHQFASVNAPVTYMEIFENDSVSVGVFILGDGAEIPLHNHPGMYGILKVLHGTLSIQNYTHVPTSDKFLGRGMITGIRHSPQMLSTESEVSTLTPAEFNIHEIAAIGGTASFLDILAPPYDIEGRLGVKRDCHYYKLADAREDGACLLREIPTPGSFWCDSIPYQGSSKEFDNAA